MQGLFVYAKIDLHCNHTLSPVGVSMNTCTGAIDCCRLNGVTKSDDEVSPEVGQTTMAILYLIFGFGLLALPMTAVAVCAQSLTEVCVV